MAKSVYSLVLSNDIVHAIDDMAARSGLSRSAFINQVLAEYASLSTPETRLRSVADAAEKAVRDVFHTVVSGSGTLTLRTALRYRYNPTVSYVVVLDEAHTDHVGEMRAEVRSENTDLRRQLQVFFTLWNGLEANYLASPPAPQDHTEADKRYVRCFRASGLEGEALGRAIAAYVSTFDTTLKAFFEHPNDSDAAKSAAERRYVSGLKRMGRATEL